VPVAPAVRVQQKSTRQNHRWRPKQPAFPARWFTGLYVLSPGTGVLAPVVRDARQSIATLTSAPGGQDHTISPSALVSFVGELLVRCDTPRPPHLQLNVRDDREAPLLAEPRRAKMW